MSDYLRAIAELEFAQESIDRAKDYAYDLNAQLANAEAEIEDLKYRNDELVRDNEALVMTVEDFDKQRELAERRLQEVQNENNT